MSTTSEKPIEDPEGRKNTPGTQWPLGFPQIGIQGTQARVSATLEIPNGINKLKQGSWY